VLGRASRLRMVVLDDNEPAPGLRSEWGWSLYAEAGGARLLFDADSDYRVIEHNSRVLGVDLSSLDYAFLSHWHRDHYGGFPAVARARPGLTVYAPPGPAPRLERLGLRVETLESPTVLPGGVVSVGPLYAESVGLWEQALLLPSPRGPVLVVGCSHPGVDRLAEEAVKLAGGPLFMVIGGFHSPPREAVDRLARHVEGYICPAHCSGPAREYVAEAYPTMYCGVRTGTEIVV